MPSDDMMPLPVIALVFLCCVAQVFADNYGPLAGLSSCPCLGTSWSPADTHPNSLRNGSIIFRTAGVDYPYPLSYGVNCDAHDLNKPPLCSSADATERPAWCVERWCYVDKSSCSLFLAKSQFFPGESNLYYSYSTCNHGASSNSFDKGAGEGGGLLDLLQRYLQSSRGQIETAHLKLGNPSEPCVGSKMCNCLECYAAPAWGGKKIDVSDVGVYQRPGSTPSNADTCLARAISYTYRRVAAKEGTRDRVGYQYFGDQASGSYVGWPNAQWCPNPPDYDPRYRPWYAAGSTGPKDVVIVVDVSGSMGTVRSRLARAATKAILETLTWKDFATIVLFNSAIDRVYSKTLLPVTDARRKLMKDWVDAGDLRDWASGGTSFQAALLGEDANNPGAFKVIRDSVAAQSTSMCQKIIMLLTDGEAEFSDNDFARAKQLATAYDAVVFTYALGDGADATKTKRMACENRGIFYPVGDNDDLGRIMSDYYKYFAEGQQSCTASYIEYSDAITREALYAACLPMYDRTNSHASLLGVSCMDVNMLTDISKLKANESWRQTISVMSDISKKCRPLDLSECHLQKMRLKYSPQSVCDSSVTVQESTRCPCLEQNCADDDQFIDEKGYFCDTWVGDNCDEASSVHGYSPAGQAAVRSKCRHSCGLCKWVDTCTSTSSCKSSPLPTSTRACRTDTVTGVDIEGCKMSCGQTGNSRFVAKRECANLNTSADGVWRSSYISSMALAFLITAMLG